MFRNSVILVRMCFTRRIWHVDSFFIFRNDKTYVKLVLWHYKYEWTFTNGTSVGLWHCRPFLKLPETPPKKNQTRRVLAWRCLSAWSCARAWRYTLSKSLRRHYGDAWPKWICAYVWIPGGRFTAFVRTRQVVVGPQSWMVLQLFHGPARDQGLERCRWENCI